MNKTITIQGNKINDIPSFYQHINELFMQEEDWELGQSLDALNDLFYGGFGIIKSDEPINLVWLDYEKSRTDFGHELTAAYYREKLRHPTLFNQDLFKNKLDELEKG